MISPDAYGATIPKEGNHFAGPASRKQGIASISKGDNLIHRSTAELCQCPLKRFNGFMNIRDNTDPHLRSLLLPKWSVDYRCYLQIAAPVSDSSHDAIALEPCVRIGFAPTSQSSSGEPCAAQAPSPRAGPQDQCPVAGASCRHACPHSTSRGGGRTQNQGAIRTRTKSHTTSASGRQASRTSPLRIGPPRRRLPPRIPEVSVRGRGDQGMPLPPRHS